MAKLFISLLLLLTITLASSARILDQVNPQFPFPSVVPDTTNPTTPFVVPPTTALPNGQIPATTTTTPATNVAPTEPIAPVVAPIADAPETDTSSTQDIAPVANIPDTNQPIVSTSVPPVATPGAVLPSGGAATTTNVPPVTTPGATIPAGGAATAAFSFFMHDILGGSHPSGRTVAGIVTSSDANNLPFSKPNNQIFPINGGVPLNTINGVINNNNAPFLTGLNGSPSNTLVQSNGNNVVNGGNNNQAFVTAGQLPQGLTVQQLMFGSATVVDNELTEGHELGSEVLGKAQGFYLTSSTDGSSHTLALTALFHGHDHEVDDTVSFFGVHRTATPISHIAIIGGTGKYENAKGYATIETLPHVDQHTTDGVETITHFTLYLTP